MAESTWQRPDSIDADGVFADLSTRQYLAPHRHLGDVLNDSQRSLGFCPQAAATALNWLKLNPGAAVGRLRRSELMQLARSIHRFWQQSLAASDPAHLPSA